MADKATEMKYGKEKFLDKTNKFIFAEEDADHIERDEFAAEIKNIFDRLRTVGSPKNYSLDEVLAMAIAAEQERAKDAVSESNKNPSSSKPETSVQKTFQNAQNIFAASLKQLHFRELMGSFLLVVMLALIAYLSLAAPVRVNSKSILDEETNSRISPR